MEVLQRAQSLSVRALVLPSTNLESSRRIAEMAHENAALFATVGFHPHQAAEFDPVSSPRELEKLLEGARAIGETGLEAHYDFCPWEAQLVSLRYHLELAKSSNLPLILHCREAEQALYDELESFGPFPAGGVVHCFTGGWEMGQKFLDLGFHLGVNGIVTLANANQVHEVAKKAPLQRLLLETDGPYLTPKPFRGHRNEPAMIPLIARAVAELREQSVDDIALVTSRNSEHLFSLPLKV
ncbi:unnamed protein product [Phaeothamnion confervicola]